MAALLTESIYVWIGAALFLAAFGICLFCSVRKTKTGILLILLALAVTGGGIYSVYFLKTDRKIIQTVIVDLADAIAENDIDRVLTFLEPGALSTRLKARVHMGLATIEWAKVRDFKIDEINYYTSPPIAHVHFDGSVGGKVKHFGNQFVIKVHFTDVELIKQENGSWKITDRCSFSYPGYNGN